MFAVISAFSWQNSISLSLLHSILQGQICLLLQVFLDILLAFQSSVMKRTSFLVLVLKGLVGLHRTIQFNFFSITSWGIGLDYRDIEWFALDRIVTVGFLGLEI